MSLLLPSTSCAESVPHRSSSPHGVCYARYKETRGRGVVVAWLQDKNSYSELHEVAKGLYVVIEMMLKNPAKIQKAKLQFHDHLGKKGAFKASSAWHDLTITSIPIWKWWAANVKLTAPELAYIAIRCCAAYCSTHNSEGISSEFAYVYGG